MCIITYLRWLLKSYWNRNDMSLKPYLSLRWLTWVKNEDITNQNQRCNQVVKITAVTMMASRGWWRSQSTAKATEASLADHELLSEFGGSRRTRPTGHLTHLLQIMVATGVWLESWPTEQPRGWPRRLEPCVDGSRTGSQVNQIPSVPSTPKEILDIFLSSFSFLFLLFYVPAGSSSRGGDVAVYVF